LAINSWMLLPEFHEKSRKKGSSGNRVLDVRPKKENIGSNSREDIA
jgi:hypothetical protein